MADPPAAMFIHSSSAPGYQPVSAYRKKSAPGSEAIELLAREPSGSAENAGKPAAEVRLSEAARQALAKPEKSPEDAALESISSSEEDVATDGLTEEEKKQVAELKARDTEVKAHERAHVAAAGGHTQGGIKYEKQRGPDNKEYAVGGHVSIDTAPVQGDPSATILKAQTVQRAALAPSEPSGADRKVAAAAAHTLRKARTELAAENQQELEESSAQADAVPEDSVEATPKQSGAQQRYAVRAYQASAA